jgi:hypothetical protein
MPTGHDSLAQDLDYLEGTIEVDPELQPEAKMLRSFFPDFPNRSYLRPVEVDPESGSEKTVLLATNSLAAKEGGGDIPARTEYRGVEEAIAHLARRLAIASLLGDGDDRVDGVLAFSQGANLLVMLLAILEAAEAAAAATEAAAAQLPAGADKVAAKAAAAASKKVAQRRSRVLRPPLAVLFSPADFGWTEQLASDAALCARCLPAIDAAIAQVSAVATAVDTAAAGLSANTLEPSPGATASATETETVSAAASAAPEGLLLEGVFKEPLRGPTKVLVVIGAADPLASAGKSLAGRFKQGPNTCTLIEHEGGHKLPSPASPSASDKSCCQRIVNFLKMGVADELIAGCEAFYRHRTKGWLRVKVTKVDYQGECDGGATYCITSPQLDGEVETVRSRLSLEKPEEEVPPS